MDKILCFIFLLSASLCYAGTMTVDKKTGQFIQYREEEVPPGSMIQEAVNCGYKATDVEEKQITKEEWLIVKKEQFDNPNKEKAEQLAAIKAQKETDLKEKFGWTDDDLKTLKEIFKR